MTTNEIIDDVRISKKWSLEVVPNIIVRGHWRYSNQRWIFISDQQKVK